MPVIIHNKSHYSGDETFVSTMQSKSCLISRFQANTINDQHGLFTSYFYSCHLCPGTEPVGTCVIDGKANYF